MSNIPQWQDIAEPMTKREIIAALMMQSYIQGGSPMMPEKMASLAVSQADALLAELKRRKEPQS